MSESIWLHREPAQRLLVSFYSFCNLEGSAFLLAEGYNNSRFLKKPHTKIKECGMFGILIGVMVPRMDAFVRDSSNCILKIWHFKSIGRRVK